MYRFPFDTQECDMKFGSWTYGGFELDLKHKDGEGRKEPQPNKDTKRNEFVWIIDKGFCKKSNHLIIFK